jgi:hypothetical protein
MEREIIIGVDELNRLKMECPKCETELAIDVETVQMPVVCASCENDLTEDLRKALIAWSDGNYDAAFVTPKIPKVIVRIPD